MELNLERMRAVLREAADVATNALEHQPEATGECWRHLSAAVGKVHQATRLGWANLVNPPRNCNVGTAEEQRERFMQFCRNCKRNRCGFRPKAQFIDLCALAWAQMPYVTKEGSAE